MPHQNIGSKFHLDVPGPSLSSRNTFSGLPWAIGKSSEVADMNATSHSCLFANAPPSPKILSFPATWPKSLIIAWLCAGWMHALAKAICCLHLQRCLLLYPLCTQQAGRIWSTFLQPTSWRKLWSNLPHPWRSLLQSQLSCSLHSASWAGTQVRTIRSGQGERQPTYGSLYAFSKTKTSLKTKVASDGTW